MNPARHLGRGATIDRSLIGRTTGFDSKGGASGIVWGIFFHVRFF